MKPPEWFNEWFNSPYYHQLYFQRDEKEAAAFIDILVEHLQPAPEARILDIACGRGRHSIYLSRKGFDITGIDLSEDSIREARKTETDNLHFYQHDMRLPFYAHYFDYVFNFFTSFGYFRTIREHDKAIRTIAHSLKPTGIFVLDYLNVHYAETHLVSQSTKEINRVVYHITKWEDNTHFFKKIHIKQPAWKAPLEYTEAVAKFSLSDFRRMFARQELHIREVFGNYALEAYDPVHSTRLIIIASKQ